MPRLMPNYLDVFNASLARLNNDDSTEFIDVFYELFIGANADIAKQFAETDLPRQKVMLGDSLEEMSRFFSTHTLTPYLQTLANIHGRTDRAIPEWMYDIWLDRMLKAVRETDPEHSPTVELAWRVVMAPGLAFMKHAGG